MKIYEILRDATRFYDYVITCGRQYLCASNVFGVRYGQALRLVVKPHSGKPLCGGHFGSALFHEGIKIDLPHSVAYSATNLDSFQPTLPYQALHRLRTDFEDGCHFFNGINGLLFPSHVYGPFVNNEPA